MCKGRRAEQECVFETHVNTLIYTDLKWRLIEVALVFTVWGTFLSRLSMIHLLSFLPAPFESHCLFFLNFGLTHTILFCSSLSSPIVSWSVCLPSPNSFLFSFYFPNRFLASTCLTGTVKLKLSSTLRSIRGINNALFIWNSAQTYFF